MFNNQSITVVVWRHYRYHTHPLYGISRNKVQRARSSAGQSTRLRTERSEVRILSGAPFILQSVLIPHCNLLKAPIAAVETPYTHAYYAVPLAPYYFSFYAFLSLNLDVCRPLTGNFGCLVASIKVDLMRHIYIYVRHRQVPKTQGLVIFLMICQL